MMAVAGQGGPAVQHTPTHGHASAAALDQALSSHHMAKALLQPTATNLNPIHVSGEDLLPFIQTQSWVQQHLGLKLPLLNGAFVLVSSSDLQQQQQQGPAGLTQQVAGNGSASSSSAECRHTAAALAAAIPWRLRQVSRVEVVPNGDPADATVVLVGGDRVRAGAVREGLLAEVQDHEYLCCEVAALQHQGLLRHLRVFDVAHIAWRLKVACNLDAVIRALGQCAGDRSILQVVVSTLHELPTPDWVSSEVLQYIDPYVKQQHDSPDQPPQLLSTEQYKQLLQRDAAAWQHYVQQRLAHQQQPRRDPVADCAPQPSILKTHAAPAVPSKGSSADVLMSTGPPAVQPAGSEHPLQQQQQLSVKSLTMTPAVQQACESPRTAGLKSHIPSQSGKQLQAPADPAKAASSCSPAGKIEAHSLQGCAEGHSGGRDCRECSLGAHTKHARSSSSDRGRSSSSSSRERCRRESQLRGSNSSSRSRSNSRSTGRCRSRSRSGSRSRSRRASKYSRSVSRNRRRSNSRSRSRSRRESQHARRNSRNRYISNNRSRSRSRSREQGRHVEAEAAGKGAGAPAEAEVEAGGSTSVHTATVGAEAGAEAAAGAGGSASMPAATAGTAASGRAKLPRPACRHWPCPNCRTGC